jgi:hypothetical protein
LCTDRCGANKKNGEESTKFVPKKHIVTFACKFTFIKRKKIHVLKPAFTTKAITEIVATANSTDEIAAGSNGAS